MRVYFTLLFLFTPIILISQIKDTTHIIQSKDTTHHIQLKDTTRYIQFDTNKIKDTKLFSVNSDTISNDFFIWNDRKNLSEIMDEKSGYFINYFGVGGRNLIKYNGSDEYAVGIFRDGIQINDNFFGGFDIEDISVNEIQKIEEVSNVSSFLYGINTRTKSINIITKDAFQPKLFSQFRYTQDRFGALSADFNINMPLSRKFNFVFGIGNHTNDGRYTNTDFSAWRGRVKLNYYSSPKFNIKTDFYYSKVQRGLCEGLVNSTDDTLASSIYALVNDPDAYDKVTNYSYDIDLTARIFNDKYSVTKLKFYVNNSLREYRDEQNRAVIDSVLLTNNFHTIQYGIDFKQNVRTNLTKKIYTDIMFGANAYFNYYNVSKIFYDWNVLTDNPQIVRYFENKIYTAFGKADINIDRLMISGFAKTDYLDNNFFLQTGFEGNYKFIDIDDFSFAVHSGANSTMGGISYPGLITQDYVSLLNVYNTTKYRYIEAGVKMKYKNLIVDAYLFDDGYNNEINVLRNANISVDYKSTYFDGYVNTNLWGFQNFPHFFVKSDFAYHNYFFGKKLNLKVGINLKYISSFYPEMYSQYKYLAINTNPQNISKDIFDMDFYVGARIGTANVHFSLANLFNKLNYDTYLYPYDDRGGFVNVISKFTIIWDFNQ